MAANKNVKEVSRAKEPEPNTIETSTRNRSGNRNLRRTGTTNRELRDFLGETKDIDAVLTLF